MLGLLVDWGYRSDGIPVRLFDAWTTLPAGPATLAAKTGVADPAGHRSTASRTARFRVVLAEPIVVASTDPAELQRATQAHRRRARRDDPAPRPSSGTASSRCGRRRDAEGADLERRARAMQAGRPDPGPGRDLPRDEADQVEAATRDRSRAMTIRGRLMLGASWLACRLPEGPLFRARRAGRRRSGTG